MGEDGFFGKATWSDNLVFDPYAQGSVSTKITNSGGTVITQADAWILVDSAQLFQIVEGAGPSWMTLRAPTPAIEANLLEAGDIRQAEPGTFMDWEVHIDGENRHVIYILGRYREKTDSYEADRFDG